MRPDYKWSIGLRKLGWNLLVASLPLVTAWLEDVQKGVFPKYGALVALAVIALRWAQNAMPPKQV